MSGMTDQTIKELKEFALDTWDHFRCFPVEFEAGNGIVYGPDEIWEVIKDQDLTVEPDFQEYINSMKGAENE